MMTPGLFHDNFDLLERFYQDPSNKYITIEE